MVRAATIEKDVLFKSSKLIELPPMKKSSVAAVSAVTLKKQIDNSLIMEKFNITLLQFFSYHRTESPN